MSDEAHLTKLESERAWQCVTQIHAPWVRGCGAVAAVLVVFLFFIGLPFVFHNASSKVDASSNRDTLRDTLSVGTLALGVAIAALVALLARPGHRVTVGQDGVVLRRFLRRRCFIPHRELESVSKGHDGVELSFRANTITIHEHREQKRQQLLEQINEAWLAWHKRPKSLPLEAEAAYEASLEQTSELDTGPSERAEDD